MIKCSIFLGQLINYIVTQDTINKMFFPANRSSLYGIKNPMFDIIHGMERSTVIQGKDPIGLVKPPNKGGKRISGQQ